MRNFRKMLCFFIMISCLSVVLLGCNEAKNVDEKSIYDFRTDFVGDNSKVDNIINSQVYPDGFNIKSFEILSDKEPYGLNIRVDADGDFTDDDLFKNAVETFALVKNLSYINYQNFETKDILLHYDRDEVDKKLKDLDEMSSSEIGESKENFDKFMNN